jgi:transposase
MAVIPSSAEEDAKRPHRERETLVGEQTTIINRIKGTLARLGIRNFNPKLKNASERLEHLRTPEGEPITPNTLAELHRDMQRRQLVNEQIRQIATRDEPAEGCRAAALDGAHHLQLGEAHVAAVGLTPSGTVVAEDVRDLQRRPCHKRRPFMLAVASPSLALAATADRAGW